MIPKNCQQKDDEHQQNTDHNHPPDGSPTDYSMPVTAAYDENLSKQKQDQSNFPHYES
ncbi:hypothetical protein [Chryseobacterium sp. MFBS3-17]|uniref:hypothetical protein n=1 Tax=Chryseobacterium sp. MFBS3-17 TaxID=2886689 RepID=UPI001D0EDD76|nr:hypothetical protein [Chryseobacterium sp. MFBS3-17]MCC2590522.1 hypothetical protein [Chryseobacterium sp. MFBS3-17]